MPIKQNAKKALRQATKKAARNLVYKNSFRHAIKEVTKAIESGEKDIAKKLSEAQKRLGKAAKKGVLSKNTAARKLSRLSAKIKRGITTK